jgi:hypothetical protein
LYSWFKLGVASIDYIDTSFEDDNVCIQNNTNSEIWKHDFSTTDSHHETFVKVEMSLVILLLLVYVRLLVHQQVLFGYFMDFGCLVDGSDSDKLKEARPQIFCSFLILIVLYLITGIVANVPSTVGPCTYVHILQGDGSRFGAFLHLIPVTLIMFLVIYSKIMNVYSDLILRIKSGKFKIITYPDQTNDKLFPNFNNGNKGSFWKYFRVFVGYYDSDQVKNLSLDLSNIKPYIGELRDKHLIYLKINGVIEPADEPVDESADDVNKDG